MDIKMECAETGSEAKLELEAAAVTPKTWGVKPSPDSHGCLRDVVVEACDRLMQRFGGPMQYLMDRFPDATSKQAYVDWLWLTFPVEPSMGSPYTYATSFPQWRNM